MTKNINRREFLKNAIFYPAGAYCLLGSSLFKKSLVNKDSQTTGKIGRILFNNIKSHRLPSTESSIVNTYSFNQLISYENEINVKNGLSKNEIWIQLSNNNYLPLNTFNLLKNISMK